ncbi:hypothetical protein FN846DRAFT_815014 [Sphaerosporella brunnea]|uniref:Uncharacterized protein n=1 Tax=Sphaerosporella brunnea TaxID=1250544 RepID=A0A5J5ES64_9PEZI|nr:hypothetical protein FN846DRAFT_815013 [Sphaerosporella brunnea]KAA8901318.1 hypothetical protein FN846DRAFT_815014 [Sphaerosporella brunnea]
MVAASVLLLFLAALLPKALGTPFLLPREPASVVDLNSNTQTAYFNNTTQTACVRPAPWNQILSFFLTNYIARIATYKKTSGYEGNWDYFYVFASLFVPFIGISGAAATIARGSRFLGHTDVDRALLAEALCVVVREPGWRPENGEVIRGCVIADGDEHGRRKMRRKRRRRKRKTRGPRETPEFRSATLVIGPAGVQTIDRKKYKIQGHISLPPSYTLAKLPPGTELMALAVSRATKEDIVISNSYNATKAFTGIVQIVSSLYAIYTAYGDQVIRYGYAAFGFTVLPYTVMSILNTIANLIEASYDCLFLVRSDVMLEAEHREGGEFTGEVAELVPATKDIEMAAAGVEFVDLLFRRGKHARWKAIQVDDAGNPIRGRRSWNVYIPPLDGSYTAESDPRPKILVQPVGQSYVFSKASHRRSKKFRQRAVAVIMVLSLVVPYAVIGGISKFRPGRSEPRQRVFMAGWLVIGQIIGALNLVGQTTKARRKLRWWAWLEWAVLGFTIITGFAFAVGGFVEAGRMLREFGYCIKLN